MRMVMAVDNTRTHQLGCGGNYSHIIKIIRFIKVVRNNNHNKSKRKYKYFTVKLNKIQRTPKETKGHRKESKEIREDPRTSKDNFCPILLKVMGPQGHNPDTESFSYIYIYVYGIYTRKFGLVVQRTILTCRRHCFPLFEGILTNQMTYNPVK